MKTKNDPSMTSFGLLRHGQTEWNRQRRIQGSADSPLTEEGVARTECWGTFLRNYTWDRILVSDLGRTQQTAAIINRYLSLPCITDSRLREQNWGKWEGMSIPDIKQHHSQELERQIARGWQFCAPDGESRMAVNDRVTACLQEAHSTWPGEKILVVCHQGVIKCLLYKLTGRQFVPGEDPLLQHNSLHFISCRQAELLPAELNIDLPDLQ